VTIQVCAAGFPGAFAAVIAAIAGLHPEASRQAVRPRRRAEASNPIFRSCRAARTLVASAGQVQ